LLIYGIKKLKLVGHGRANYINGPLVAGASSLPANGSVIVDCGDKHYNKGITPG